MHKEHPFLWIFSCSARLFVNDAMATFVKLDYRKNIITIQTAKNISLRISATDMVHGMFLSLSTLMHFDMRRRIESWFWRKCVIPLPLGGWEWKTHLLLLWNGTLFCNWVQHIWYSGSTRIFRKCNFVFLTKRYIFYSLHTRPKLYLNDWP